MLWLWAWPINIGKWSWMIQISKRLRSPPSRAYTSSKSWSLAFQIVRRPLTYGGHSFWSAMGQMPAVYIDDIIFGVTFQQTLANLETIFERLRSANRKLKPKKCVLFQNELSFLGRFVSANGVTCNPEKISVIQSWPTPTSVSNVRWRWIGCLTSQSTIFKSYM